MRRIGVALRAALPSFLDLHVYGGAAGLALAVGSWFPSAGVAVFSAVLLYLGLRKAR